MGGCREDLAGKVSAMAVCVGDTPKVRGGSFVEPKPGWLQSRHMTRLVMGPTMWISITVPTKARLVKAMVFPVVMYGCESWTIKKAERRRIDVFELWCWRRFLRVPWTARRSNHSILKEISLEYSLEGLIDEAETPILWPPDATN